MPTREATTTAKRRSGVQTNVMLSRVAHSLYWMSRYVERAENIARLLAVNMQFLVDFQENGDGAPNYWHALIGSLGEEEAFARLYGRADRRTVASFLALDRRNPGSILGCVLAARENARMVRDQISLEMWETLNELHVLLVSRSAASAEAEEPQDFFTRIIRASHAFQGLTVSTYSRNEGWEFIQCGKFLERADCTSRILDVKYHILLPSAQDVGGALDTAQWQAVLRSASALEAYRREFVREILPWKAAEFLICSPSFPRSIYFCATEAQEMLRRILQHAKGDTLSPALRTGEQLEAELQSLGISEVLAEGLHEFLVRVQQALARISDELAAATMFYAADAPLAGSPQQ